MPSMKGKKPVAGKQYWRSLNELADKPEFQEFVEREFPSQASEFVGGGESRRTFLKIMGASAALAGLASCRRWPEEKLVPYAHRPANRMDGEPVHYRTAFERGGLGQGVVAVSFDGRPTKVDGNPEHPFNQGTSDALLQASILNVYDPDRSRGVVHRGGGKREESNWQAVVPVLKGIDKSKLVVLAEASRSPSVARLRKQLVAAGAKWFEYEAIGSDNQVAGLVQYAGRPLRAVPKLNDAAIIVSIDADLFHGEPLSIKFNRDFSSGRKLRDSAKAADAKMNRLYVVESGFTITGSMADHRIAERPSRIPTFVAALHATILGQATGKVSAEIEPFLSAIARDINANKGKAVVVAGSRQPAEVHAVVAAINAAIGAPVDYYADPEDPRPATPEWKSYAEQIKSFASAVTGASTVLIIGANPVYSAPSEFQIGKLLKGNGQVQPNLVTIHIGTHEDETAQACTWHIPQAHYLEAWGDVRAFDGTISIAQPLIEPIFGGKSTAELLSAILQGGEHAGSNGYELVKQTAEEDYLKGRFSTWAWKKALFDGVIAGTGLKAEVLAPVPGKDAALVAALANAIKGGGKELALHVGAVHDGRYANNGWLVELPDPITRVSWENPVLMSPKTAGELGLISDDEIKIAANGREIEARIFVMPGQADDTLSMAIGYGRETLGSIADGVGSNGYAMRSADGSMFVANVTITPTGRRPIVACVQDHHIVDAVGKDRLNTIVPELVVEGTFEQYQKKPRLGTRKVVSLSAYDEHTYKKGDPFVMAKWGMAIDLTTCTGCSACVIACQAENNIPIVGKQMVYRGREMHWLRIDRYFKFPVSSSDGHHKEWHTDQTPQLVHQPLLCMHCENAPCEEVCPVAATTHSHEGLNMMTYNRCVGTRYCSNNCPYKVRRFNFFDFNAGSKENLYTPNLLRSDLDELVKMQKNPQVTVRSRGVMEKCTYCVQRIEVARIKLLAENRGDAANAKFEDGSVRTACQDACPTDAIVFGDLNDEGSRVSKMHKQAQSYKLLDPELNTKPRTWYLAKVRNNAPGGLDEGLYNKFSASEGWKFEEGHEHHVPHETHGPETQPKEAAK